MRPDARVATRIRDRAGIGGGHWSRDRVERSVDVGGALLLLVQGGRDDEVVPPFRNALAKQKYAGRHHGVWCRRS